MNRTSNQLLALATIFTVSLIVANIIAGKLISIFGLTLTAGVICFPLVYIVGDVVPEVYGLARARKIIWVGFAANLLAVGFFLITLLLPYPPFWENQEAYQIVLGVTPRLLLASVVAYLIGTNANAATLVTIKKMTGEKFLWTRTIGSTIVGETIDSIIFMLIAFYGVLPNEALPVLIASQAGFKIAYEIVITPFTYLVVNYVKRQENYQPAAATD